MFLFFALTCFVQFFFREPKLSMFAIEKRFSIPLLIIINLNFSAGKIKVNDSLGQGMVAFGTKCGNGKVRISLQIQNFRFLHHKIYGIEFSFDNLIV